MKSLLTVLMMYFVASANAYEVACDSICEMKQSGIKFCVQISDKQVNTNVYYTGAKGDNIEINAYPFTDLNEVVKEMLMESRKTAPTTLADMLSEDAKNISCVDGKTINFVDTPVAAQYFK